MVKKRTSKKFKKAKRTVTAGVTAKSVDGKLSVGDRIIFEREIRRYVRADGGYRKGLAKEDKVKCEKLLKRMGRTRPERDKDILVPGLDKPTVAGMIVV